MNLATSDVARLLVALTVLLIAAHGVGALFARLRQPRVIGEIVGGLLLGPTALGAWSPHAQQWIFPKNGPTATVLGAIYQLGLLLLMYLSGIEVRSWIKRREARTGAFVLILGTTIPFLAGIAALGLINESRFFGPSGNARSFLLVFAIAMAVTSIPVISRIMFDLGILGTPFSRIVLGVAVVEDIILYVVLAVALGIAAKPGTALYGLPGALGLHPGSAGDLVYHAIATVAVLGLFLLVGRPLYRTAARSRFNMIRQWSPVAFQLVFMLAACVGCVFLGIQPFFGAFVAGIAAGAATREPDPVEEGARVAVSQFAFAFFIPIYFAVVGLQLDLLHGFSVLFFLGYLAFACAVKALSVYAGARVGGQRRRSAVNLAVAMNARGGPGIVLASVAYGAGIINQSFYAVLVLLAIVTSLLAGSWLGRVPREQLLLPAADRRARSDRPLPDTTPSSRRA
ncbi:MAG TPA: cation:proton antiporter [Jatrophihabitans sp.]|nr:cation:proton antiporter [Jatrophihabitans sp.]